jgi:hypothetical protein
MRASMPHPRVARCSSSHLSPRRASPVTTSIDSDSLSDSLNVSMSSALSSYGGCQSSLPLHKSASDAKTSSRPQLSEVVDVSSPPASIKTASSPDESSHFTDADGGKSPPKAQDCRPEVDGRPESGETLRSSKSKSSKDTCKSSSTVR